MSEKHTVAMFVTGEDGSRVQVGWASPKNEDGVRTFEYSPGYEESRPKNVSFEDDELSQQVAAEQAEAREPITDAPDPEQDAERVEDAPDEEKADDPTDASFDEPVELNSGGEIIDSEEPEDEEEAEKNQPQTRREARENEDGN